TLMDNAGKPLNKVENPDDHDSEDEVESIDNDMAHSMASKSVGFGIKSLLEQLMDSYENDDYDEDPYDDWKRIFKKRIKKRKPKATNPSTEWKGQSQKSSK
ncbi:hypothetical protein Tco_0443989, partial [Tanacetum coccineum]